VEDVAPPLKLSLYICEGLKNGYSLRYLLQQKEGLLSCRYVELVRQLVFHFDQGIDYRPILLSEKSPYRRSQMELILIGLQGEPILLNLEELQMEIEEACNDEIEKSLKVLPFLLLGPTLIFLIPAYLLILFGPIISHFISGVVK